MKKAIKFLFRAIKSSARLIFKALKYSFPPVSIITDLLKDAVNNPKLNAAVLLTETKIDDKIITKLRAIFRQLDPSLKGTKGEDTINKFVESLSSQSKLVKDATLMKIGSELTKEIHRHQTGRKIKSNEADLIFQLGYSQMRTK